MTRVAAVVGGAVERGAGTMTEAADRSAERMTAQEIDFLLLRRDVYARLADLAMRQQIVRGQTVTPEDMDDFAYWNARDAAHEARKLLRLTGELGQEDGV